MLQHEGTLSVPAAVTQGLLSLKAVSTGAAALAQATLKAMLKAKVLAVSMNVACVALLLIGSLGAYRLAAEELKVAPPASVPAPAPAKGVFIPQGGKIVLDLPLPARAPKLSHLKWSLDGRKMLAVVDRAWNDNKGSRSRQGEYDVDLHIIDVEQKSSEKLLSNVQNIPSWLDGNRLLVCAEGKLWVYDNAGKGERHEIPGKEWFRCDVSPDGKSVVYISGVKGGDILSLPVMLYDVETAESAELPFPMEKPAGAAARMRFGFWTNDGRYCLGASTTPGPNPAWTRFLYDPVKGTYTGTERFGTPTFISRITRSEGSLLLSDMTWLSVVSQTKRPESKPVPHDAALGPVRPNRGDQAAPADRFIRSKSSPAARRRRCNFSTSTASRERRSSSSRSSSPTLICVCRRSHPTSAMRSA